MMVVFLLSNQIYAKYNYQYILDAFSLSRDTSEIVYQIEKSVSDSEYTNKDITLRIIANKQIEPVEGFELDDSRTSLTKIFSENEEKNIVLEDLSGNRKELTYSISNIDKEPPKIVGVEDGITYNKKMTVQYTDNVGVKDIKIDRYSSNLRISCVEDYYDTGSYKGLDVLGNQIYVNVREHPKGTVSYKYYLNNVLKATTNATEYTYKGLAKATTYTIKVEAVDKNGKAIKSVSQTVKTKWFTGISGGKSGDNFNVKITGIDSKVSLGYCALWHQNTTNRQWLSATMNSDRSVNLSFNAYQVDGTKSSGYYYFHLQLVHPTDSNLNEVICMNIKFDNKTYVPNTATSINPNSLNQNGNYEIIVTDLAGNQTVKCCTISL